MNTPDERKAAAYESEQNRAAYMRGEPVSFGDPGEAYSWAGVKPYPAAPRLSHTLVLDHTPQELADKLVETALSDLHPVMAAALRPLFVRGAR